jgi:hypothetical protein
MRHHAADTLFQFFAGLWPFGQIGNRWIFVFLGIL